MVDTSPGPIVAEAPGESRANERLLCPFDLQVWSVDRMLNFEITDHPQYEGLELQVLTTRPMAGGWPSCSGGEKTAAWTSTGSPA